MKIDYCDFFYSIYIRKGGFYMIQSIYNNLVSCYSPKRTGASNNTHKRSELRRVYNRMVKVNKNSPLYRLNMSDDSQIFAIGLKESSMELNNVLSSFVQSKGNVFDAIQAKSSNPEIASVNLTGNRKSNLPDEFLLEVESLAKPQINSSIQVPKVGSRPKSGSYSFIAKIEDEQFEFQFNLNSDNTNQEILTKLANFINKSKVGLTASTHEIDSSYIEFHITSKRTGKIGEPLFELWDTNSPEGQLGLVEYYGLNNTIQESANAQFSINGEQREASKNQFVLNRCLEVNFTTQTEQPVSINYIPDSDKIFSSIKKFTDTYNHLVQLADDYPSNQGMSKKLVRELKGVMLPYRNNLESCGIEWTDSNKLEIDESLAKQAIEDGDMQELFSNSTALVATLLKKASYITINPIHYIDKTLITYPNFNKPGTNRPYISSLYTGLLFNYYC